MGAVDELVSLARQAGVRADDPVAALGWLKVQKNNPALSGEVRAAAARLWRDGKSQLKEGNMGTKKIIEKAMADLARNTGAVATTPVVDRLQRQIFGGSRPFAVFEARVAAAQKDLEKARLDQDDYAAGVAKQELRQAQQQLTTMKMIAAENARERDPGYAMRALRGQGVPLLTNRHALGDDPDVQGI
ncbi:MAG: hypothetical protein M0004_12690 [Actinomycetota bacterium]|nr:hypothetical protein [Actinomycetota bacterium]